MEDPSSVALATADGCLQMACKNGDMKNSSDNNDEDRWCTSSARSRSSTSFLIHNLLISCSGPGGDCGDDGPAPATSPPSPKLPVDDDDETSDSKSDTSPSKSRSCSPLDAVNKTCAGAPDRRPAKRRKCTYGPLARRRGSAKKKYVAGSANACSDDSDCDEKGESKKSGARRVVFRRNEVFFNSAIEILLNALLTQTF